MNDDRVRPAVLEEAEELIALWLANGDDHRRLDEHYYQFRRTAAAEFSLYLARCLKDPNWCVLAAVAPEDEIAGLGIATLARRPPVMLEESYGFIDTLFVREEHRRQGVGRRLVA